MTYSMPVLSIRPSLKEISLPSGAALSPKNSSHHGSTAPVRQVATVLNEDQITPRPWLILRWAYFWAIVAMISRSSLPSVVQEGLTVLAAVWLGTFPHTRLLATGVETRWWICFLPWRAVRTPYRAIRRIETSWEEPGGLGEALCLGLYGWLSPLLDWLFPLRSASRQIYLDLANGRRRIFWRGNSLRRFRLNLAQVTAAHQAALPQEQQRQAP